MTTSPAPLATTGADHPDVQEMVVVHRAFRREFAAVPGLVRAVAPGDTARARVVGDHLSLVLAGLHMHHTGEDVVLWPLLLERAAPRAALMAVMEEQHRVVEARIAELGPLTRSWAASPTAVRGEQLARSVEELTAALVQHLDLEEREVLPLATSHVSAAEWDSMGDHGKEVMSARQLPIMFGAVLEEADPAEARRLLAKLPLPVRVLLLTWGRLRYRRYTRRVRRG